MPRIVLKPNSPEYADDNNKSGDIHHVCEMPGCREEATHKAPKHRGLNEYHHFCLRHVQDYNRAWNFFEGMSENEVQSHMTSSIYGDRPTWRYDVNAASEDILRQKAWQAYMGDDAPPHGGGHGQEPPRVYAAPEVEAMAIMGLEPPLSLETLKERYKELAKKHHPDLNKGCSKSEELLKQVNMAYTVLKVAHEKFKDLPDQKDF